MSIESVHRLSTLLSVLWRSPFSFDGNVIL